MRWLWLPTSMCLLLLLGACKPNYPNCESDSDCPGNAQKREWCVNGQCQACRPGGSDCGPGKQCQSGRCAPIPGYCSKGSDCPTGVCERNRCAACKSDNQCPSGGRCNAGRCEADSRKRCSSHDDCAESEDCINGRCTPANRGSRYNAEAGCQLEEVRFGYNEFELTSGSSAIVDKDADCLKRVNRGATLTGHTDPRGTQEYNLALSEKRAQAVKRRLRDLGVADSNLVTVPRGELDATGTDEASWERDRRVDVQWR